MQVRALYPLESTPGVLLSRGETKRRRVSFHLVHCHFAKRPLERDHSHFSFFSSQRSVALRTDGRIAESRSGSCDYKSACTNERGEDGDDDRGGRITRRWV